ncbi:OmpA family protein [Maridesulfovibrio hydrothermalis]|uniref:OmpA/MotB domain protein n=1 Tax=Maridesulfovibrio hydrothermalis AM13 = DSM 14728 TaxID=1121451 RepID=L0R9R1_9BACT|nr:OmpA family protein [Maridesulfovibrio hydrothermalis]CCO22942.1 OmpA/MotB domain protein [Maridesulfovibrio hydrothermalis AM13 = DSM 14728]
MKKVLLSLLLILVSASTAMAQGNGFASSSKDMLSMLTGSGGKVYLKIEFEVGSAKISKSALSLVDALGSALISADSMEVKLIGHTDSAGKKEYNRKLSLDRAVAVKKYLADHFKISASRIKVAGMGEDKPVAPNNTAQGRALNRRVEVINISPKAEEKALELKKAAPALDTKSLW